MKFIKQLLLTTLKNHPEKAAISIESSALTYEQFLLPVIAFNKKIYSEIEKEKVIGVLVDKTIIGFQSIASIFLLGKIYVPLNINYPIERNTSIIKQAGVKTLLIDSKFEGVAKTIYQSLDNNIKLILLKTKGESEIFHTCVLPKNKNTIPTSNLDSEIAYLLFTSGSTGKPKGVPISDENIKWYLKNLSNTFTFSSSDRFSCFFDFTFDLSLHDMLVCWKHGACLCPARKSELLFPLHFAKKQSITIWFSVPSLALTAKDLMRDKFIRFRLKKIRYSFFCGEALPSQLAQEWFSITNQNPVINLYGPTESTIAFTAFNYLKSSKTLEHNIVPIGKPIGNNKYQIMNRDGSQCSSGEKGELCLNGTQVFSGYLRNNRITKKAFHIQKTLNNNFVNWYRTGDIVSQQIDGTLLYHGRNDRQVQVKGFRVELQEVEQALRKIISTGILAVIAYPQNSIGEATGLTAFVASKEYSKQLISSCEKILPNYMVPKYIIALKQFPFNGSGKLDYNRLIEIAKEKLFIS